MPSQVQAPAGFGPLTVELPEDVDTNETYWLVYPDGSKRQIVYNTVDDVDRWEVMPF